MRKSLIVLAVVVLAVSTVTAQAAQITVAEYKLGENDPGAVVGAAGNATTVALVGADAAKQGTGQLYAAGHGLGSTLAMSFPGTTGNYYKVATPYDLGTDNWGMECWVNTSTTTDISGWAMTNGNIYLGGWGNEFLWNLTGNPTFIARAPAVAGWHKMGLEKVDGVMTAYLDGAALTTTTLANSYTFGGFSIGARAFDGKEAWLGSVDDVRLYKIGQVPEPGTLALLALGVAGLVAYAWRKRK